MYYKYAAGIYSFLPPFSSQLSDGVARLFMVRLHHQWFLLKSPDSHRINDRELELKQALVMEFMTAIAMKTTPEKIMKGMMQAFTVLLAMFLHHAL
jgi:hypothetical protein